MRHALTIARRELAAYEIQKLFLDERDYVVPPTTLVCLPLKKVRKVMPDLEPHGAGCEVHGSFWIGARLVRPPDPVDRPGRFEP